MSTSTFSVTVATVSREIYSGEAVALHVVGTEGEMTILAHHEPLISNLVGGDVSIIDAQGATHTHAITKGVLEVANNKAVVLCSSE